MDITAAFSDKFRLSHLRGFDCLGDFLVEQFHPVYYLIAVSATKSVLADFVATDRTADTVSSQPS